MRTTLLAIAALLAIAVLPSSASAATCAAYATQAEAQRAADTRDADGDGVYCESLPCPCQEAAGSTSAPPPPPPPAAKPKATCSRPSAVQRLRFSSSRYPTIKRHTLAAIAHGWPRVLVLNRSGTAARRDRLLEDVATRSGFDRDEYPAAVGRGRANGSRRGLVRGRGPIGWMADVMYVPSGENRSHGASLGAKLRRLCDGTRFRYVFT
ncbi:MAG: hypothetical protein QOI73_2792 [Solirubrobacteraceae bacterium]|nr:hypothetical protein [Solirubrobacteraceae bacterium]